MKSATRYEKYQRLRYNNKNNRKRFQTTFFPAILGLKESPKIQITIWRESATCYVVEVFDLTVTAGVYFYFINIS